jgi:hypothetical protein
MNHFISGILKIVILEASVGLLLLDRALGVGGWTDREKWNRQRLYGWMVIAGLSVFAWCNYGSLRGNFGLVHNWEQFHFYIGAKYQREVGWFDLYKAVLVADRESANVLGGVRTYRDCETFEQVPVQTAFDEAPRIRARFSDERWAEFKQDWYRLLQTPTDWGAVLNDHGNSNSPAWSIFAHPISRILPLGPASQTLIGWLDMALMIFLFWNIFRAFGIRASCAALVVWSMAPIVFDYLAGSFLRWDWMFAVGMAACFLKRGRYDIAGAFAGYAVATKLFPMFFVGAVLFKAALDFARTRRLDRKYLRFGVAAAASLSAAVLISSLMFGFSAWPEYKRRINAAQVEKFYGIQYSLRTVYLQVSQSSAGELTGSASSWCSCSSPRWCWRWRCAATT